MRKKWIWFSVACLIMTMTGCIKQAAFDFSASKITQFTLVHDQLTLDLNMAHPLDETIMRPASWIKIKVPDLSQQSVLNLKNEAGQIIGFYPQTDKVILLIKDAQDKIRFAFEITLVLYEEILKYINQHYIVFTPGNFAFVKAMAGMSERSAFEIDPVLIGQSIDPADFTKIDYVDTSTMICSFSLLDFQGNLYSFFPQEKIVKVSFALSSEAEIYSYSEPKIQEILTVLMSSYAEKMKITRLDEVRFVSISLDGLASFDPQKMHPVSQFSSDLINTYLNLKMAEVTNESPRPDEKQKYVLKDEQGLYYVLSSYPYIIGVGKDPNGTLTYFTAVNDNYRNISDYLYRFPIAAPANIDLGSLIINGANALAFGGYAEQDFSLTSAQGAHVTELLNLSHQTTPTLDFDPTVESSDGILLRTSANYTLQFRVIADTGNIILSVVFDDSHYGVCYYEYADTEGHFNEAYYYLTGAFNTAKADPGYSVSAYFIGNANDYSDPNSIPVKTLNSAQILHLNGLLQKPSWQVFSLLWDRELDSEFLLRINDDSYLGFTRIGSLAVVSYSLEESRFEKQYLIPLSAYQNVLAYLKTLGS